MRVICNDALGTYTFVPVETEEEQVLASVAEILKPGDKMPYGGRRRDGEGDKFCMIELYAGARAERQSESEGRVTVTRTVHVGGVKLVLRGSTEDDKYQVNGIRNTCYFCSGSLIFVGEVEVDGKKAIVVTAKYCKLCGRAMIDMVSCEWDTCSSCAKKCEHNYVRGPIHCEKVDVGMGEFCDKCGRGKPLAQGEKEKTLLEHHVAVEQELGVRMVYANTCLSASQIDFLHKAASVFNN